MGDWQALVLDQGYYYPPHLDLGAALDVLNRTELLEILQRLLATEYPQQRPSKVLFQQFIEAFERLKDERAWRRTEMERLAAVLDQYQSDRDRIMAELVEHQSERQRLGAELDHYRNQATMLHASLADLRASTSWRVTRPLRWFGRLVKAARVSDG